jgi:hypothetical protein
VLAGAKFVSHERLVEPDRSQVVAFLSHQYADLTLAEPARASVDFDHFAADRLQLVFLEIRDRTSI